MHSGRHMSTRPSIVDGVTNIHRIVNKIHTKMTLCFGGKSRDSSFTLIGWRLGHNWRSPLIHMQPRRRDSRGRIVDFLRIFRTLQNGRPRTTWCRNEIDIHSGSAWRLICLQASMSHPSADSTESVSKPRFTLLCRDPKHPTKRCRLLWA